MNQVLFYFGILLGWAVTPQLWPVFLPPRLMLYLGSFVGQESGWNTSAHNTKGEDSIGLLQFNSPARAMLGMTTEDAQSPFWSGYFGAKYTGELLFSDWRYWLYLSVPILGLYWLRAAWRGFGAAETLESGGILAPINLPGDSLYQTESAVKQSYWRCIPIALAATIALLYAAIMASGRIVSK